MKPKRNKTKRGEILELKRSLARLKESQWFMRRLLACACLKYGKLTLDTQFYRIPEDPEILTHQDHNGQTIVELRAILPIDPKKHTQPRKDEKCTSSF